MLDLIQHRDDISVRQTIDSRTHVDSTIKRCNAGKTESTAQVAFFRHFAGLCFDSCRFFGLGKYSRQEQ